MNTKDKGNRSTAVILAALMSAGYHVLIPFGENQRYDLVVDIENRFIRIQCKTAWKDKDCRIVFNTKSVWYGEGKKAKTRMYTTTEIDAFMIYSPDTNKVYVFPVGARNGVALHLDVPISKRLSLTQLKMARDYEFTGKLPSWV